MEIVSPPPSGLASTGEIAAASHRAGLAEDYPHLAPSLATPCDFLIYRKDLA
ncbi:hypothetical protein [Amycolatopsis sp. NPDC049159]|uniref:hypothetical protein n=1 Tax=Amycolatopsis sp. NPDC049159 TaxID=3157210 RepID=UPI00340CAADD